jgi:hypothetical protein
MKTSPVQDACLKLNLKPGTREYSRAYRALHQRKVKLQQLKKPVTAQTLLQKPLRQLQSRTATRSKDFKISSLSELFDQEAKLSQELEGVRKEIVNAFGKGIREARKRKINIAELIEGCGYAVSELDEKRDG